jgi:hypothetical protein
LCRLQAHQKYQRSRNISYKKRATSRLGRNAALLTYPAYRCLSDNTNSGKYEITDAVGEFQTDITVTYRGLK